MSDQEVKPSGDNEPGGDEGKKEEKKEEGGEQGGHKEGEVSEEAKKKLEEKLKATSREGSFDLYTTSQDLETRWEPRFTGWRRRRASSSKSLRRRRTGGTICAPTSPTIRTCAGPEKV